MTFSKNRKGSIFGKGLSLSFRLSTPKSKTERIHDKIIEQNGSKMSLDGNDPPSEASSNASSSIAMGPTSHDFDSFGESGEMPARFERRSSISNLRSSWPPIGSQHGANILGFSFFGRSFGGSLNSRRFPGAVDSICIAIIAPMRVSIGFTTGKPVCSRIIGYQASFG